VIHCNRCFHYELPDSFCQQTFRIAMHYFAPGSSF
jgi:hypothetical protein